MSSRQIAAIPPVCVVSTLGLPVVELKTSAGRQ